MWWMTKNILHDKSTLVQVMAWYCQATSHHQNQCWPRYMSPYGVTGPQWAHDIINQYHHYVEMFENMNIWNVCQLCSGECVFKVWSILFIIVFPLHKAVCYQVTQFFFDDKENISPSSYHPNHIRSNFRHYLGWGNETKVYSVCVYYILEDEYVWHKFRVGYSNNIHMGKIYEHVYTQIRHLRHA